MEFRTLFGELSSFQDRPEAVCLLTNSKINDFKHCPIYNFDDEGQICVPAKCVHYRELKGV